MAKGVIARYNRDGYEVELDDSIVYQAGNSPYDSQDWISRDKGLDLKTLRSYAIQTGKEIAEENNTSFLGIERMEDYEYD